MTDQPDDFSPEPGKPVWYGFHTDKTRDRFDTLARDGSQSDLRYRIDSKAADIRYVEREIDRLMELVKDYQRAVRRNRDLRAAEQTQHDELVRLLETSIPQTDHASQLDAIRRLPGVLGFKYDGDEFVVMFRTQTLVNSRLYFLGDYEIRFYLYSHTIRYKLYCTLSGLINDHDFAHPYWSPSSNDGHSYCSNRDCNRMLGRGSFCFGYRATEIDNLLQVGEIAQALQLMIASMNRFNPDDRRLLRSSFKRLRLTPRRLRQLLAYKAQGYVVDIDEHTSCDPEPESDFAPESEPERPEPILESIIFESGRPDAINQESRQQEITLTPPRGRRFGSMYDPRDSFSESIYAFDYGRRW